MRAVYTFSHSRACVHDFKIVGDIHHFTQHDGRGTIFFRGQTHRPFNLVVLEAGTTHHKMNMNACKHLGILHGPVSVQLHHTIGYGLAGLFQNNNAQSTTE